jgi:hypothetical protein
MEPNRTELTSVVDREKQVNLFFDRFDSQLKHKQYELINAIIFQSYLTQEKLNEYSALVKTQQLYESVASQNVSVALCLMTELYDKAADTYSHDLTDGIDLWIDAEGNADLLAYILTQNELPHKIGMHKVYEDWISFLRIKVVS